MRYILLLQSDKVSVFAMGRARFGAAVVFNNNPSDHERFSQYLAERHTSLFSLVIDSKDEEHHLESIPVLKNRDRQRMLKKITNRHFPDNTLSTISFEKNQKTPDRVCPVTASGMPLNNDCQTWLELLDVNSVLLTNISSFSLLGQAIHQLYDTRMSLCAIQIAQNEFRLLAYHNSRLIISRHLTIADNLADELTAQLHQTLNYLSQLPLASSNHSQGADNGKTTQSSEQKIIEGVRIVGALPANSRAQLERSGATVVSCRAMSRLLGIKPEISVPFADGLFAALALNRKSKHASLSMGCYKNHYLARRLRHMLYAGSIACFGVTAVATAAAVHYDGTYSSLIATTVALRVESNIPDPKNLVAFTDTDIPVDAIRDSMRIAAQLQANSQFTPLHFLSSLASDLTIYPELEVSAIHWSKIQSDYSQVTSESKQADSSAGAYYNATVTGYLQMKPSGRVQALSRFNSFVTTLTTAGRYISVTVVEAPFGISDGINSPDTALSSVRETFVIELSTR